MNRDIEFFMSKISGKLVIVRLFTISMAKVHLKTQFALNSIITACCRKISNIQRTLNEITMLYVILERIKEAYNEPMDAT